MIRLKSSISEVYESRIKSSDLYSIARVPTPERILELGWQARVDLPHYIIPDPIDWTANPYNDRNWYAQFHGWRFMDPFLRYYYQTKNKAYLNTLVPWICAWPSYRDTAESPSAHYLGSLSGMRATRLAILLDAYRAGDLSLTGPELATIYNLVMHDVSWLTTPGNIAMMNHDYFQIFGLELISRVLSDEDWATAALQIAKDSFDNLVESQFTSDGVHVENSPCYHQYALGQIHRSGALHTFASNDAKKLLEKAAIALPWFVFPDGTYAEIGDSTGPGAPLSDPKDNVLEINNQSFAISGFHESGYIVVRTMPDVPLSEASMLLFAGASLSHTHSHADKLSFELMESGKKIIVDAGKYGYTRDKMRQYVESANAHNVVGLSDHVIRRTDVTLGSTKLSPPQIDDQFIVLNGNIEWHTKRFSFRNQRVIKYRPGALLLIEDSLFSDSCKNYASRLHFDRSLDLRPDPANPGRIWRCIFGKTEMLVEILQDDALVTLYHGQTEPEVRGWQSVGYLQMAPCPMLEARLDGTNVDISWAISFSKVGS